MQNVRVIFKIMNGDEAIPPTYQEIRCRMIFDVKMEDLWRKALFVACGYTNDAPHAMTYTSVVLLDSVRIALTMVAFNDVNVKMTDIENAYMNAPITVKKWTVFGPEFGDDTGNSALIVRVLYGLKSAGVAFRNHFSECMNNLGWKPFHADRDLWMKAETPSDDGILYSAYMLIYVDDILCVYRDHGMPLAKLDEYFKMK
jgi:hypothetical protein